MSSAPNQRTSAKIAPLILLAVALTLGVGSILFFYLNRQTAVPPSWDSTGGVRNDFVAWFNTIQGALFVPLLTGVIGALILWRRVAPRIGWLFLSIGLLSAGQWFLGEYAIYGAYTRSVPLPGTGLAAWVANFIWIFVYGALLYLLAIFPNGRFLSRRWRGVTLAILFVFIAPLFVSAVIDTPLTSAYQIDSPFIRTRPTELYDALFAIGVPAMPLAVVVVLGSVLLRFRRSQGRERQQMKWLLAGVVLMAVTLTIGLILNLGMGVTFGGVMVNVSLFGPLVGVGIALLRHQLYDIDIIIQRTLLYTAVSATLALVYFGSILLLQTIFSSIVTGRSPIFIVISTLVSVALFNPLRGRLQTIIDRRFFRQKYNARQVLAQFAQTARDETNLNALTGELTQVVQKTLQPDQVHIWLRQDAKQEV